VSSELPADDRPEVSIVIVGHSVRTELQSCFESIHRCAGLPVEILYVDNASTDDTLEWIGSMAPEVTVIPLDRNRFGAARTPALERARGRYTMFLDSDARLTEGALRAMVEALDYHSGWGLVGPRLVYDDGTLQLSCRRYPPMTLPLIRRPPLDRFFEDGSTVRRHLMADTDHGRVRPVLYVISACQLFRTSLGREVGAIDPQLAWGWEDTDWCIRIRAAGAEVVYFPEATVIHSYRRMTRRRPLSRDALRQLGCHLRFQRKYLRQRRALIRLGEELDRGTAGAR
jgi:N-acetylglucosaminyl-diphospho-decaprenol L-rhamnosyltransferase